LSLIFNLATIIEKNEIDNDYFIELTEYNHLKCKLLNKIDYHKQPQMDELIITKNISCGEDHSLLLDSDGNVWSFGYNLNGQLGLGHTYAVERPNKIKSFKNKIVQINSEDDINFAVDEKGETYMWPCSDKNGNVKCEPVKMPFSDKIQSISCGHNFALFLSAYGGVYSMGKTNMFGQLGHGDITPRLRPTLIEFFPQINERISYISCGYKHCAALSLTGKTYTWGLVVFTNSGS
jgi:alpha-tubulin suppressor-like RCC1 family protein